MTTTDRFGLEIHQQGEDNWSHDDTVQLLDELAEKRDVIANRPASGTYDNEVFFATDENIYYRWDAGTTSWNAIGGRGASGSPVPGTSYFEALDTDEQFINDGTTVTVNVPTDYATVADAVDHFRTVRRKSGTEYVVNIETGHTLQKETIVKRENLGNVRITSEDATVQTDANWADSHGLRATENAVAPVWDIKLSGNGSLNFGYKVDRNSIGFVTAGSGADNASEGLSVTRHSFVTCEDNSVWTNCDRGVSVTFDSGVTIQSADCTGASSYGIRCSDSSVYARLADCSGSGRGVRISAFGYVNFQQGVADNCTGTAAISVSAGSKIWMSDASVKSSAGDGIEASGCSTVVCDGAVVTNATDIGLLASSSYVYANGADFSGGGLFAIRADYNAHVNARNTTATTNTSTDVAIVEGAWLSLHNATTTNGTPAVGDTSVSSFNSLSTDGAILA